MLPFVAAHPEVSKRQVELKIAEIAEKEKRPEDAGKVWHVKVEFEYLLQGGGAMDVQKGIIYNYILDIVCQ